MFLSFRTGNLTDIKKAGSFHEFLVNLHRKYGPVVSFWWGKQLVVTLGSPKVFKEVQTLFNRTGSISMDHFMLSL